MSTHGILLALPADRTTHRSDVPRADDGRADAGPDDPLRDVATFDDFEDFVVATADTLLRAATLLCGGDRQHAEDLVQSTLATAYVKWHLVSGADNPVAYVRTILTRTFLAERRRRRVRETPLEDAREVASPTADPSTRLAVTEALATLSPRDRAVLVLRYYYDLSFADTAAQLRCSESSCRTRSSRALKRLRERLPDLAADLATEPHHDAPHDGLTRRTR